MRTSPVTAEPEMVGAGEVAKVPILTATVSALVTTAGTVSSLVPVISTLIL